VNKEDPYNCIALLFSPYKRMRVGWNNRSTSPTYTTGRHFGWM